MALRPRRALGTLAVAAGGFAAGTLAMAIGLEIGDSTAPRADRFVLQGAARPTPTTIPTATTLAAPRPATPRSAASRHVTAPPAVRSTGS